MALQIDTGTLTEDVILSNSAVIAIGSQVYRQSFGFRRKLYFYYDGIDTGAFLKKVFDKRAQITKEDVGRKLREHGQLINSRGELAVRYTTELSREKYEAAKYPPKF